MVGETADPVLLSSRAGGRWLTAGALVLTAARDAEFRTEAERGPETGFRDGIPDRGKREARAGSRAGSEESA